MWKPIAILPLLLVIALSAWQHLRHRSVRRNVVQDRQPLIHSTSAFHVMTFVEADSDDTSIADLAVLRDAIESNGGLVVYVYYPGPDYFADLIGSRFFQGIIGDKQLSDTQAVPTVPILDRLDR